MRKMTPVALIVLTVFATAVPAEATGTMSTVGGYSNHHTVGIVTQVEGGAFVVRGTQWTAQALNVGAGLEGGDRIWVEPSALVRLSDTHGGRVTIAGPAVVEPQKQNTWRIYSGSVKFKSSHESAMSFTHAIVAGKVSGEAALWAAADDAQILALAGDVKVWHPKLSKATVAIAPGFYSESARELKHLQPSRPERVAEDHFQIFMAKFEKSLEDQDDPRANVIAHDGHGREIATTKKVESVNLSTTRGSRHAADVIEASNEDVLSHVKARIAGKDEEDEADDASLAAAGAPRDAYGRLIRPAQRGLAQVKEPRLEIVNEAPKPAHTHGYKGPSERYEAKQEILRKLRKLGGRIEVKN